MDSNNIRGNIPNELCVLRELGHLQKLFVDCERGKIVQCECCECRGNQESSGNWTYNQKKTWSKLASLSGDTISNQSSPQYAAAQWIVEKDNWHNPVESTIYLYQRYVLVLFYYMMGEQSYFEPDSKVDECEWERVECNQDRYVE